MAGKVIAKQLDQPRQVHLLRPRGSALVRRSRHLKTNVGTGSEQGARSPRRRQPDTLQDVLKGINFNRKIGQRTLDDTHCRVHPALREIPLGDEDFEFPDLLGAAYEYLIKYFADSAGKKGGEFYTPAEVVRRWSR